MSKKMYIIDNQRKNFSNNLIPFSLPIYHKRESGDCIEFSAYDPALKKMRRKRYKLSHIRKQVDRKKYAKELINKLTENLYNGWNPWIHPEVENLPIFTDVCNRYLIYIEKMRDDGIYRKETCANYRSWIKNFMDYANGVRKIYYLYQMNREYISSFLDYIYVDKNNSAQTRNNYLNFLRVFSSYCFEKGFSDNKPTEGISLISKRLIQKKRTTIPSEAMKIISDYLMGWNKNYLFVCYLIYYCFIRPIEITQLKIRDFKLRDKVVVIPANVSKNKKEQAVTIPKKVMALALELEIFDVDSNNYVVSTNDLKPGRCQTTPKVLRDYWAKVKKELGLKPEWKLYSLKDSGITHMLNSNMASIYVRDQARHSSLEITNIYAEHTNKANNEIVNFDGDL